MSRRRLVLVLWMLSVGLLSYLLYTPLPQDLEDQFGATFVMVVAKLVLILPQKTRELLGQGLYLNNLRKLQSQPACEASWSPVTSWFGGLNVTRATIEGLHVIVYKHWDAEDAPLRPGFIYFHGGGWVIASADSYDWNVYDFALCTGSVAISVDYSLAPQHPFPAAFNDALSVTRHILRHGRKFGIDATRVGVAGDSTGGNLAAATALHVAKTPLDHPLLRYQVLICPMLQALDYQLPSYSDNDGLLPILTTKHAGGYASIYLGLGEGNGDAHGEIFKSNRHVSVQFRTKSKYAAYINKTNLPEKYRTSERDSPMMHEPHNETVFQRIKHLVVDPRFSPLMADDVSGLPRTHIVAQRFDVVRDDGLLYAKRLRDAGVETSVHTGNGFHIDHIKLTPEFLHSKTGAEAIDGICRFVTNAVKQD
ncbi:hypothetical protein RRG08_009470 [Elysia crispata]|uniref:Alpha/beta hydrolase fold-3 domain-containing protein n=1 Tax=Elysia crispata TaxID=231223 RepID=A0AAE1E3S3_9GAST|nr:hypothetical protein RRG08_009470 [Elysia crispata]